MPIQLFLWLFVTAIYASFRLVRRVPLSTIGRNLGLPPGKWYWYIAGIAVAAVSLGIAALGFWLEHLSVATLSQSQSLTARYYASWNLGPITFLHAFGRKLLYTALGEELFFRGLVAGSLFRHLKFQSANACQTLIFLLPHLAILALVNIRLWPLVVAIAVGGWLLGWLRHASGSIFPGVICHALMNAIAAAFVMAFA